VYAYKGIRFESLRDILQIILPSGRRLYYHAPRLDRSSRRPGTYELSYEGWNTNPKNGAPGWIRQTTYGGKLVENITQAVARDILANAIVNLEEAGFPVVLHVHDEIVAEVPTGNRTLEEFERIMSTMPEWCDKWPVVAKGGWIGKRYCK
jgi:DNA polymerase